MTATDKRAFAHAFNRLAVATRLPADQGDQSAQRIYFEGLVDLPIEAVLHAAGQLETRAAWFPKLAEWRQEARRAQRDETRREALSAPQLTGAVSRGEARATVQQLAEATNDYLAMRRAGVSREDAVRGLEGLLRAFLVPGRSQPWRDECEACGDSGWEVRTCYTDQGPACGVRGCHRDREHTYAVACSCRETNRTWQRSRAVLYGA
jgi:hypothetical protein